MAVSMDTAPALPGWSGTVPIFGSSMVRVGGIKLDQTLVGYRTMVKREDRRSVGIVDRPQWVCREYYWHSAKHRYIVRKHDA